MKVYRWEETEEQVIAYVRPDELFDETTILERKRRPDGSAVLGARHRLNGEFQILAFINPQDRHRRIIEAEMKSMPELYVEQDEADLRRLHEGRNVAS